MAQSIMHWDPKTDDDFLRDLTAKDSNIEEKLDIYLAVSHLGGVVHWSIVWKAYAPGTTKVILDENHETPNIGFKIMEVRNPRNDPQEFAYRFSYRRRDSQTVVAWKLTKLASLGGREREALKELGEQWSSQTALGGNCITCVRDLVKFLTKPFNGGPGVFPMSAIVGMDKARDRDLATSQKYVDTHQRASTGLSGLEFAD